MRFDCIEKIIQEAFACSVDNQKKKQILKGKEIQDETLGLHDKLHDQRTFLRIKIVRYMAAIHTDGREIGTKILNNEK